MASDRKASLLEEAAEIAMDGWHSVEKARAFACAVSDYLASHTGEAEPTLLQDLHNELYLAQRTESVDVLLKSIGKARLLLARYRDSLAAPGAAIAAREQGSDHARLDYVARSLRSIADRGRAGLGDSYPEILSLCITMRDMALQREEAPDTPPAATPAAPGEVTDEQVHASAYKHCFKASEMAPQGEQLYLFDLARIKRLCASLKGEQPVEPSGSERGEV